MAFPPVGILAPDFSLQNQDGKSISLMDFRHKKNIVLYFYPKALTPGCTVQACGIKDSIQDFDKLDAVVLGVSPDAPGKLIKFKNKYELNFDLLADENNEVAHQYGVWALKKFMGREFMGIVRTSFIIDKDGCLAHIVEKINTKNHHETVLDILRKGI